MKSKGLLILVIPFIFSQKLFGDYESPSVDFQYLLEALYNETSMEAFHITTCLFLIDSAYDLLLIKKIIGNAKELKEYNFVFDKTKGSPVVVFPSLVVVSIYEGLKFTVIPALMNYFVENLYSLSFETTYWKEHVINFATHQGASYLLIGYKIYSAPHSSHEIIKDFVEIMTFIFIFQNYGVVATFVNLTLSSLLTFCRMNYMGW